MKRLRGTDFIAGPFPAIDVVTGESYAGTAAELTNTTVTAERSSDNVLPVVHVLSGMPVKVGNSWYVPVTAAESNIDSQRMIILIDADEISAQWVEIELVDELPETTLARIEATLAAVLAAIEGLNDIAVADITGSIEMKEIRSFAAGSFAVPVANSVAYKDVVSGETLFTAANALTGRTVTRG